MKIKKSKEIGFCFGVRRAINMVEDNIKEMEKPVKIYGCLAHNEKIIERIKTLGIKMIDDLDKARKGTLIITAHGVSSFLKNKLQKRVTLFDTTCPMVNKAHKAAEKLKKEKRKVLIFGDPNHREVKGIKGSIKNDCQIFSSKKEFLKIKLKGKYGLISQTTQDFKEFEEIKEIAEKKNIKVINTICKVTYNRQKEAEKIAKKSDLVLVIGSKKSANTNRLFKITSNFNKNSYFIKDKNDLKKEWFRNKKIVGIIAGASTPDSIIKEIIKKINE